MSLTCEAESEAGSLHRSFRKNGEGKLAFMGCHKHFVITTLRTLSASYIVPAVFACVVLICRALSRSLSTLLLFKLLFY